MPRALGKPSATEMRRRFGDRFDELYPDDAWDEGRDPVTAPPPAPTACDECDGAGVRWESDSRLDPARWARWPGGALRPHSRDGLVLVWCERCPRDVQLARQLSGIIQADLEESTFKTFEARSEPLQAMARAVKLWVDRTVEQRMLVLSGPVGVGKSHLAKAAAVAFASSGHRAHFTTTDQYLQDRRASFDGDEQAGGRAEMSRTSGVLVWDDLGAEHITQWTARELASVIMERYERRLLTLITTNDDLKRLARREADDHGRLLDRLSDVRRSIYVRIDPTETSYRTGVD